ncbi:hypothetical protein [Spirosoma oryzicola]|uniref:hypothetical protein n=1 Tax=Spirosoma oryzicola TaxID=2898794 RepID=UPI001E325CDA|nr:hypothetical protein [Spirosoma oryzicola]UHG93248.1 hypothetical protein LQ777_10185 [Spirosoma oryzicola]
MPKPSLTLVHLKSSVQYDGPDLITRHWFQWSNRKSLGSIVLRVELLDSDGKVLTEGRFELKKTTVTGYLPNDEQGNEQPIYDTSVWLQLDDVVRDAKPWQFRYFTANLLSKSDKVTADMSGKFEDISQLG